MLNFTRTKVDGQLVLDIVDGVKVATDMIDQDLLEDFPSVDVSIDDIEVNNVSLCKRVYLIDYLR
jgi:hypothetical protein